MRFPRSSGIIAHPTSLPGAYGIGEIGPEAVRLIDMLSDMGQSLWQVLPLGPTGYADSPYQSTSSFGGNTLLISLEWLAADGLLEPALLRELPPFTSDHVDFATVIPSRTAILKEVCRTFPARAPAGLRAEFDEFREREQAWLADYALFAALKEAHDLRPWIEWPAPLATRDPAALSAARRRLADAIRAAELRQFLFLLHWQRVHAHARIRRIGIIGDIPIFVAHDSADVWAHPELFLLDARGQLLAQAGVPPDYFSETGQLWGNPLYRWDVHADTGYAWWIARMRKTLDLVDRVRIDHFRGFAAHWEIPGYARTARHGRWVPGPGAALFDALHDVLGNLPIIAEDLGVITRDVEALRERYAFPGMRILQFAFGADPKAGTFRPEAFPENCVAYTGTHDNDTTVGWFRSEPGVGSTRNAKQIEVERRAILEYFGTPGHDINWDMIAETMASAADTAIVPIQDIMGLDSRARMNIPGTRSDNWKWRFTWNMLTPRMIARMRELAVDTGRSPRREGASARPVSNIESSL